MEKSDNEIHFHLNYSLLLWKKSFKKANFLKASMLMENTSQTTGLLMILLYSMKNKKLEKQQKSLNSESLKVGLKIYKDKRKYMTNSTDSRVILIEQEKEN